MIVRVFGLVHFALDAATIFQPTRINTYTHNQDYIDRATTNTYFECLLAFFLSPNVNVTRLCLVLSPHGIEHWVKINQPDCQQYYCHHHWRVRRDHICVQRDKHTNKRFV